MKLENQNAQLVKTGVTGLDIVLGGGLAKSRVYLLEGTPGAGKTTLSLQFLLEGVKQKESCLYITMSESKEELENVAESHGWDLSGVHIFELISDEYLKAGGPNTFFHPSEIEMGETNQAILDEIKRINPSRVVIDSLSELKLLAQDAIKMRRQILALKSYFLKQGATVLLLDDKTTKFGKQDLQSIVHGVIHLDQLSLEFGSYRRRIRISKLRGISFRGGYHDFILGKGGLIVFPRLIASEHGILGGNGCLKSDVKGLDNLLGGGIERGSATLIMGPAGSGKSSIAIQYAVEAASRGEHASVFLFEEGMRTLLTRSRSLGLDLEKLIEKKMLTLKQINPAELSPGEFAHYIRECVEKTNSKIVIIDSLTGYLNAMPEEKFLIIQMHELLSYLSQMGVATFIIVAQHGLIGGGVHAPVDVSYLADNVILLRYFENFGEVRRALSVVKKRSGGHERTIRELTFNKGLFLGDPLNNFQGVLSGLPVIMKSESIQDL